jgi:hypothetical protein
VDTVKLGSFETSRFMLGSNPFSGFSHQSAARDAEMVHWYTSARIKELLRRAEELGITGLVGRADRHIIRALMEYWDEGGKLQWSAQTCPGVGPTLKTAQMAIGGGARAVHIHGGVMDNCLAAGDMADPLEGIEHISKAGLPVGIAGHNPEVFRWAEREKLPVDYYMCSYYNSANRDKSAEKLPGQKEWFREEDRATMTELIGELSKPVIHYKVMAAGRNDPAEAIGFAVEAMRPQDAICIGIFTKDNPEMLAEDVRIFEEAWSKKQG